MYQRSALGDLPDATPEALAELSRVTTADVDGDSGVVTAVALRLVPAIAARAVAWAGVASPTKALDPLERPLGAVEGSGKRRVVHRYPLRNFPIPGKH